MVNIIASMLSPSINDRISAELRLLFQLKGEEQEQEEAVRGQHGGGRGGNHAGHSHRATGKEATNTELSILLDILEISPSHDVLFLSLQNDEVLTKALKFILTPFVGGARRSELQRSLDKIHHSTRDKVMLPYHDYEQVQ